MTYDFDAMLQTIKDKQWSLADIDWDAPGAETITEEVRAKLQASDLVPVGSSTQQAEATMKTEIARWAPVVKRLDIKAQ